MHNATSPTTPATPPSQKPFLTTEQFLTGLRPAYTRTGQHLPEPFVPFGKLKAVVSLLLNCQDEDTQEMRIDNEFMAWALILVSDLIEEAEKSAKDYQNHCHTLYDEIKARLNTCHLIADDYQLLEALVTGKEV